MNPADDPTTELMYRYEDVAYAAPFDDTGRLPGTVKVELRTYQVVRRTAKGMYIALGGGNDGDFLGMERFMLTDARRRFACPTLDEARVSFIARKSKQARIYKARMERALRAIAEINRIGARP